MTTPTTVQVKLQLRADTAATWASVNPVLLNNELALETDTKKLKVGNGSTAWNSLAYFPFVVSGGTVLGNLEIGTTGTLTFEGSTADGFETTLGVVNPTADRTINLPDQSGTVVVTGNASIVNADIAADAEIAVSKLADGAARQLLQTDAAGTGVEWTSNVDVPGTLDVTGAATFDSAVTIAGDLTVNGTTTNINTQNLVVEDKNIILADVATPTDTTADGGGITLKGATDKTITWSDTTDAWTSNQVVDLPAGSAATPSLIFGADVNSGIYSPGADQLAISTNGAGRLFVDSSGRVGVGTATPSYPLSIFNSASNFIQFSKTGDAVVGSLIGRANVTDELRIQNSENAPITLSTNNLERARITSDGNVGIGTTGPTEKLRVVGASGSAQFGAGTAGNAVFVNVFDSDTIYMTASASNATQFGFGAASNIPLFFMTNNIERARIDSSGRLLVGTSSAPAFLSSTAPLNIAHGDTHSGSFIRYSSNEYGPFVVLGKSRNATTGSHTSVQNGDYLGQLAWIGSNGTDFSNSAASISCQVDGEPFTSGDTTDLPGRLVFSTTADGASSPTERMRIGQDGAFLIRTTSNSATPSTVDGTTDLKWVEFSATARFGLLVEGHNADAVVRVNSTFADNASRGLMQFYRRGTLVGSITGTNTATAYNTSSDYRLKENVVPLTGAIDRLNQLQVHRFSFIADPDKTVDGFIAHEAQAVVPECVTGTKDEVDDEGNPVYQGIDQSKLVPLLTAALQEALAEIESLKARVTALEP